MKGIHFIYEKEKFISEYIYMQYFTINKIELRLKFIFKQVNIFFYRFNKFFVSIYSIKGGSIFRNSLNV